MERQTRQRRIIQKVFRIQSRPLSPAEIHGLAAEELPGIGIATVYRTIRDLEKEGKIKAVHIPGVGTHYEPLRHDHHDHFHCKLCGRVFEVDDCLLDTSVFPLKGYIVEGHEITFHGICGECSSKHH